MLKFKLANMKLMCTLKVPKDPATPPIIANSKLGRAFLDLGNVEEMKKKVKANDTRPYF